MDGAHKNPLPIVRRVFRGSPRPVRWVARSALASRTIKQTPEAAWQPPRGFVRYTARPGDPQRSAISNARNVWVILVEPARVGHLVCLPWAHRALGVLVTTWSETAMCTLTM